MECYAGIDVSLERASVCVVDVTGRIVCEAKIASEPEALIAWFGSLGFAVTRIGLEAGPLSQWLHAGMRAAGLAATLLETRHVRAAFKTMPVKTDKKDARGIAQLMRLGARARRRAYHPDRHRPGALGRPCRPRTGVPRALRSGCGRWRAPTSGPGC